MKRRIIIALAFFAFSLSLAITLYPIISTEYNERHQAKLQLQFQQQVDKMDTSALNKAKADAVAYNQTLKPGAQIADIFSKEGQLTASEEYGDLLNLSGNGIMGYVRVPSIHVSLPIYHGTSDMTLEKGVGHLLGTSLPVGGTGTHAVLTAHSGMANAKMFSDLDTLRIGDIFYVDVLNETLAYQVDQIKVVLPHDTTYLGIVEGGDHVTLVTCTPFGVNTHRLLVRGSRIAYEQAEIIEDQQPEQTQEKGSTWEKEYKKGIFTAIAVVLIILLILLIIYLCRRGDNDS